MPRRDDDYTELRELALAGIDAEVKRLNASRQRILAAYPISPAEAAKLTAREPARSEGRARRHRQVTDAQRKAVSARMKAYWASRRAPAPSQPALSPGVTQGPAKRGRPARKPAK